MKLTSNTNDLADELNELKLKIARRNVQINSLKHILNRHYATRSPFKYSKFFYNDPPYRFSYFYPAYPCVDDRYLNKYYENRSTAKSVAFTSHEPLKINLDTVSRSTILTKQEKQFTDELLKKITRSRKLRAAISDDNLTSAKSTLADHSSIRSGSLYLSPLNKKGNFYNKHYNQYTKQFLKPSSSTVTKLPSTARLHSFIDSTYSQPRWLQWYRHYLASRLQYPSAGMDYYCNEKIHLINIPADVESIMDSAPRYPPTMAPIQDITTKKSRYESDTYFKCRLPSCKQYYYTQKLRSKSNSEYFLREYDPRYEFSQETISLDSTDNLLPELPEKVRPFIDEFRNAIYEDIIQNIRLKQQAILSPHRPDKNKNPTSNTSRLCERNLAKSTKNLSNCTYIPLTYNSTLPRSRHELASRTANVDEKTEVCGENKYTFGTQPCGDADKKYTDYICMYKTATKIGKSDYPYPTSKNNYSGDSTKEFPSRSSSENNEYNKNHNYHSNGSKFSLHKNDDENVNISKYSSVINKEPQTTKFGARNEYKNDKRYTDESKYTSEFMNEPVGVHSDYKNDNQSSDENKYSSDSKKEPVAQDSGVYNGYENIVQYLCANNYSSEPVSEKTNISNGYKNESRSGGRKCSSELAKTPFTETLGDINDCKNDKIDREKLYKNNIYKCYTTETPDKLVFQELEIQPSQKITSTDAEPQINETFSPTRRLSKCDISECNSGEKFTENSSHKVFPYSNDDRTQESNHKTCIKEFRPASPVFQKIINDSMNEIKQNHTVNPSPVHSRSNGTTPFITRRNSFRSPLASSEECTPFQRKVSVDRSTFPANYLSIGINESPPNATDRVFQDTIILSRNHLIIPFQEFTESVDTSQEYYQRKLNIDSSIQNTSCSSSQMEYSKPVSSPTQPTTMMRDAAYRDDLYQKLNDSEVVQNNEIGSVEQDSSSGYTDHHPLELETREYDQKQSVKDPYRNSNFKEPMYEQYEGTDHGYQYGGNKYESTYQPETAIHNSNSNQEISPIYNTGSSSFNQYSDQGAYTENTFNDNVHPSGAYDTTEVDAVHYNDQRCDRTSNCSTNNGTSLPLPDYNYDTSGERYLQNTYSSKFPTGLKNNLNESIDQPSQHTVSDINNYSSEQPASLEQFLYNSIDNKEPSIEYVGSSETQDSESNYIEEQEIISENTTVQDKLKDVTSIKDRKRSTDNVAVGATSSNPRRASRMISQTSQSLIQSPDLQKRTSKTKLTSENKLKRTGSIISKMKSPTVKRT